MNTESRTLLDFLYTDEPTTLLKLVEVFAKYPELACSTSFKNKLRYLKYDQTETQKSLFFYYEKTQNMDKRTFLGGLKMFFLNKYYNLRYDCEESNPCIDCFGTYSFDGLVTYTCLNTPMTVAEYKEFTYDLYFRPLEFSEMFRIQHLLYLDDTKENIVAFYEEYEQELLDYLRKTTPFYVIDNVYNFFQNRHSLKNVKYLLDFLQKHYNQEQSATFMFSLKPFKPLSMQYISNERFEKFIKFPKVNVDRIFKKIENLALDYPDIFNFYALIDQSIVEDWKTDLRLNNQKHLPDRIPYDLEVNIWGDQELDQFYADYFYNWIPEQ